MSISRNGALDRRDGEVENAKWVEGRFGQALEFNNSAVIIPHPAAFTLETFTVAGWVKCEMQNHFQTIVAKSDDQGINYLMSALPNGGPDAGGAHFHIGDAKINAEERVIGVTGGKWHHMAMTRDNDGDLCGYVDGREVGNAKSQRPGLNNAPVSIGASGGGTGNWMIGSLDEIVIFNRALSKDEINDLMNDDMRMFLV